MKNGVCAVVRQAKCFVDMLHQHIVPALKAAEVGPLAACEAAAATLSAALAEMHAEEDEVRKHYYRGVAAAAP